MKSRGSAVVGEDYRMIENLPSDGPLEIFDFEGGAKGDGIFDLSQIPFSRGRPKMVFD